ncbi:MAG: peptide/nickel transport system permease protein [Limisphaerales bacterium]|jgi:peptide/nickel transport system permease protein
MGPFTIHLLTNIGIVAILTLLVGLALFRHFAKTGIDTWKAFIPFYNLFEWAKLTRNGSWLVFLLLWAFPLPMSWMVGFSFIALAMLVMDTYGLYKDQISGYWLIVLLVGLVGSFANNGLHDILPDSIPELSGTLQLGLNAILFLVGLGLVFKWSSNEYKFDKEAYDAVEFSFQKYALKQFRRNIPAMISVYILGILVILAVFAPYIANDQPLYAEYGGNKYYPAWTSVFQPTKVDTVYIDGSPQRLQFDITNWKQLNLERVVWSPIPYSQNSSDRYNRDYADPGEPHRFKNLDGEIVTASFRFRHHAGTDQVGKDVLAGLIHGTRISLTIGLISMGIATLIGIILGSLAGYYGDNKLKVPRAKFWLILMGTTLFFFYALNTGRPGIGLIVFTVLGSLGVLLAGVKGFFSKEVTVPVDTIVSKIIEILNSLPRLLIIITITAVFGRGMTLLMIIIGVTSWTGIARFTRAEFLRTRSLEFIDAARSLGYSESRVIFKHALPNSIAPVFVAIAFGIASAILIESGLSFLGIGVPDDLVTWGQMLSKGRLEFEAWWLVFFPGAAIFITITAYNLIGEALRDALDPKLKQ